MAFIKKLVRYSAYLYPNAGKQSGRINLFCVEDDRLYLLFHPPGETLSPNEYDAATKIGLAYQTFSQYQHYLDLVRNEKPIYVSFSPEVTPPSFVVFCAEETPGEGEI